MSVRLLLTDAAWAEIAPILATMQARAGSPPVLSDRMCIEAVLSLARTGTPGRDLPEAGGHWDAGYNRLRRWERRGLWRQLWARVQAEGCPLTRQLFIDATIVRAHQHAAGALKKTVAKPHRLWGALGAACRPKSMPAGAMNARASPSSSRRGPVMRVRSLSPCSRRCPRSMRCPMRSWTRGMTAMASESSSSPMPSCR
jgi:transposase